MAREGEPAGCLTAILRLFGVTLPTNHGRPDRQPAGLPYRLRHDFLTPAERSFYGVLLQVVQDRAVVFAKVRVADLLYVPQRKGQARAQNRINAKHVDFVLCRPDSLRVLAALELDDSSHEMAHRKSRDAFLAEAFAAADLPLLRVAVRRHYEPREVAELVESVLRSPAPVELPAAVAASDSPPTCPRCELPMLIRTAGTGRNSGRRFYGCRNYPKCRETVAIE